MRGNSQLLRSANLYAPEATSMKTPVMLLLTCDNGLEELLADLLSEIGGVSHLTRDAGDALETICGVEDLDLAIIDFEHGPHGMTLLSAINTMREHLPVIVITRDDEKHVEALAYANGASACFPKPVAAAQLSSAIHDLCRPKPERALI
jgi:DNA-binding NtrC family response regulator